MLVRTFALAQSITVAHSLVWIPLQLTQITDWRQVLFVAVYLRIP